MNEMLEKFDSASDGQLLEKEHFLGPEESPTPERFEVKDSGSVVASDVSGPARDVGVVSLDTATSDDECDDPPVVALLPRRGCSNSFACSDESGDASDASPKPSGCDFADEAASSDDERQSARVAVDGNEKADTDRLPKGPKEKKVQRKSAQRAASELQQIYSTSQRMVR
ncbi:unnamed protein product, partial [Ixodes pacificus]